MLPHLGQSDIVTASYSTFWHFLCIFGHFGGQNDPQGGLREAGEKFFRQKDVFYVENLNDILFSSMGHLNGKLFNFSTFFGRFW